MGRVLWKRSTRSVGRANAHDKRRAGEPNEKKGSVKDVPGLICQRCARPFTSSLTIHGRDGEAPVTGLSDSAIRVIEQPHPVFQADLLPPIVHPSLVL